MMQKSTVLIVVTMTCAIAILLVLGTWQLNRLSWKEELISGINARVAGKPVPLVEIESLWSKTGDVDYMPVQLTGRFDHEKEMHYFNTWEGQTGWNVITPFHLSDNRLVLVNRGFVPSGLRDKNMRTDGLVEGLFSVVGLARNPVSEKPNSLIPDNLPSKREFYWKSFNQMALLASQDAPANILPFMVDAGANNFNARFPLGGTTRVQFSNNHLQYAGTWYGLALALLAVGSVFLYRQRKPAA
jgi:surfeit locus 1 family protein